MTNTTPPTTTKTPVLIWLRDIGIPLCLLGLFLTLGMALIHLTESVVIGMISANLIVLMLVMTWRAHAHRKIATGAPATNYLPVTGVVTSAAPSAQPAVPHKSYILITATIAVVSSWIASQMLNRMTDPETVKNTINTGATAQSGNHTAAIGGFSGLLHMNPMIYAALLFIVLIAPIAEEMLFRGCIHESFRRRFRAETAIGLSTSLFVLAHLISDPPWTALAVGLTSVFIMEATRSLWPAITTHIIANLGSLFIPATFVDTLVTHSLSLGILIVAIITCGAAYAALWMTSLGGQQWLARSVRRTH